MAEQDLVPATFADFGEHRIRLRYETEGPLQFDAVTEAFDALRGQYQDALRRNGLKPADSSEVKLYVTELRTGSLEAEIATASVVLGAAVQVMDVSLIITDFTRRLGSLLRYMTGKDVERPPMALRDVDHVSKMLDVVGDHPDGSFLLQQARLVQEDDGLRRRTIFELGLNREDITTGLRRAEEERRRLLEAEAAEPHILRNALFYWHTASIASGSSAKRTLERGVVETISPREVKVFFPEGANELKRRMTDIEGNPFRKAFVVDVAVQTIKGRPQLYTILEVHEVFDRDDDAPD